MWLAVHHIQLLQQEWKFTSSVGQIPSSTHVSVIKQRNTMLQLDFNAYFRILVFPPGDFLQLLLPNSTSLNEMHLQSSWYLMHLFTTKVCHSSSLFLFQWNNFCTWWPSTIDKVVTTLCSLSLLVIFLKRCLVLPSSRRKTATGKVLRSMRR